MKNSAKRKRQAKKLLARQHAVKESNKQEPHDKEQNPQSDEAKGHQLTVRGRDLMKTDETECQEDQTTKQTQGYLQALWEGLCKQTRKPKFWVELLALAGLGLYTCETRRTNNLTDTIIKNNERSFRQDQRPYIWLNNNLGEPKFLPFPDSNSPSGYVVWAWHFQNYGKTPARDIRFNHNMQIGDDALSKPRTFDGSDKPTAPLPPGKDDFSSSFAKDRITREEFQRLMSIEHSIVVYGRFTYTDAFGSQYETGFCIYHLKLGPTSYCPDPSTNYIK